MKKKRILSLAVALAMLFSSTPAFEEKILTDVLDISASAAYNPFRYIILEDGTAEITGYSGGGGDIVIPSAINDVTVSSIASHSFSCQHQISSVVIPGTVKNIGSLSFDGCEALSSVTIQDGVKCIGFEAFSLCPSLKKITIPKSVTSIGRGALIRDKSLETIELDVDNPSYCVDNGILYNKDKTRLIRCTVGYDNKNLVVPNSVLMIDEMAFSDCMHLDKVTLPDDIEWMGDAVFQESSIRIANIPKKLKNADALFFICKSLERVTIPQGTKSIGYKWFTGCTNLKSIVIPNSVTKIEEGAFAESGLKAINIPSGVKTIGDTAFASCASLSSVALNNGLEEIGEYAFNNCSLLKKITLPANLKTIKQMAFSWCPLLSEIVFSNAGNIKSIKHNAFAMTKWLKDNQKQGQMLIKNGILIDATEYKQSKVVLPNTVKIIAGDAFIGNTTVTSVTLPSGVKSIGEAAFCGCENLTSINIPNSVEVIENSAFQGAGIKSLTIPGGVKTIEAQAFAGCPKLESVVMQNGVTKICDNAFDECTSLKSVSIPESLKEIGTGVFVLCRKLTDVKIPSKQLDYNCLFGGTAWLDNQKKGKTAVIINNVFVKYNGSASSYTIPDNVTMIASEAFMFNETLKSITIPRSVKTINGNAFSNCPYLDNLVIPGTVKTVGGLAFGGCTSLKNITLENGIEVIGAGAFSKTKIEKLTVPGTVKEIEPYWGYSDPSQFSIVKEVVLGDGVKTIKPFAFQGYTELEKIVLPDTIESIGTWAFGINKLKQIDLPKNIKNIDRYALGYLETRASTSNDYGINSNGLNSETSNINSQVIEKAEESNNGFEIKCYYGTEGEIYAIANDLVYSLVNNDVSQAVVTPPIAAFYTGQPLKPDITVTINGKKLKNNTDYIVEYEDNTDRGEGKFTIKGINKFIGTYEGTFIIGPSAERLAGKGRFETAVEISKAGFPDGTKTVVLAYGLNYADALAGVSLAKAMNAPILLTNLTVVPNETLAEIKRLGATDIVILGGTGAIGTEVEDVLKKEGLNIERIADKSRFETATKIAQKLQELNNNQAPEDIFFVYYNGFADALSVSTVAAVKSAPVIYLKTNGDLDDATANYLKSVNGSVKNAYVIGGTGVISDDMMKKTGNALGVTPIRVFGKDRFATCVAVNDTFKDTLNGNTICVATGMDFPDALAGGVFAAMNKAPLFLVNGKAATLTLSDTQKSYLKTKSPQKIYTFGGIGVVPDSHVQTVAAASV